jgi:iron complex transport system ATP-binding protein
MTDDISVSLKDVTVRYGAMTALDHVTVGFAAGTLVGLIGPNGAGKTTLLKVCMGLIQPAAGAISLAGAPLISWPAQRRARKLGYLPQGRTAAWPLTAARLVALGRLPHLAPWQAPGAADAAAVDGALRETDALVFADRPVTALSGGELARVLIARVLAGDPDVLLADEPIAGLDPAHSLRVMELFRGLAARGRTVIVVLHDLATAARFCQRLVVLNAGRLVADGTPAEVMTPDVLARHYGIEAAIGRHGGEMFVVPWTHLP